MAKVLRRLHSPLLRWTVCVAVVAFYNNWLLTPLLNPHISLQASLISEISALTQPHHVVFQVLDITAGLLTLTVLPLIAHFAHRIALPLRSLLLASIAIIGLDSVLDASLPINCAPSVEPGCSLISSHSIVTTLHMTESSLAGVILLAAPSLWWWACRRQKAWREARHSMAFVALQVLAGSGILLAHVYHLEVVGALQRLYELGIGAWIASLVYGSIRTHAQRYSIHLIWNQAPTGATTVSPSLQAEA